MFSYLLTVKLKKVKKEKKTQYLYLYLYLFWFNKYKCKATTSLDDTQTPAELAPEQSYIRSIVLSYNIIISEIYARS